MAANAANARAPFDTEPLTRNSCYSSVFVPGFSQDAQKRLLRGERGEGGGGRGGGGRGEYLLH